MSNLLRPCALAIAFALVQFAAGVPLNPSEWRYSSPILSPQIRTLQDPEVDRILAGFCETPVRAVERVGLTCTTRQLGPGFSDIVDRTFHPKGAIFGHFLDPESDDAAVGGASAEGHPYRWGGTLLLSRRGGAWIPIWYRSALIIDSCEKIALPDRREILLCEDEDSGMGRVEAPLIRALLYKLPQEAPRFPPLDVRGYASGAAQGGVQASGKTTIVPVSTPTLRLPQRQHRVQSPEGEGI